VLEACGLDFAIFTYVPHCGQILCGNAGPPHSGQGMTFTFFMPSCERRLPTFDFE
jgi:hypothetical protein